MPQGGRPARLLPAAQAEAGLARARVRAHEQRVQRGRVGRVLGRQLKLALRGVPILAQRPAAGAAEADRPAPAAIDAGFSARRCCAVLRRCLHGPCAARASAGRGCAAARLQARGAAGGRAGRRRLAAFQARRPARARLHERRGRDVRRVRRHVRRQLRRRFVRGHSALPRRPGALGHARLTPCETPALRVTRMRRMRAVRSHG